VEAELLRNHSDIEDVAFEGELLLEIESLSSKIGLTLVLVILGVLLIATGLTFQSVRVALRGSRDWARAVSLVGGSRFQIRQPFIYTGSLTGLMGGIFGSGGIFIVQYLLAKGNMTPQPDPLAILLVTVFTMIIGSLGALAAIPTISVGKKVS
jgi:cell division protein FtsX